MSRTEQIYRLPLFVKSLLGPLLAALVLTGCASSGNRMVYTQPEDEFGEWIQSNRTILVTEATEVPEEVLLVRNSRILADTAKGAGKGFMGGAGVGATVGCVMLIWIPPPPVGCVLGAMMLAPPASIAGLAVGGVAGAAASEPEETSHSLSQRLAEAPVLMHEAVGRDTLEQMLSGALLEKADEHVHHTFLDHRHEPPRLVSPFDPAFRSSGEPLDAQGNRSGTIDEFDDLSGEENIDGILVLDLVQWGFAHKGEIDPEETDPELMLVLRASSTLHFSTKDRIEKTRLETQTYEGSWHRLSDFMAGNDGVLGQELQDGIHALAGYLLADLEHARREHRLKERGSADLRDQSF